MKWIKVAIGAVIAVLSIGIIATTVFKMTQPREDIIREVSVEIDPVEGKYYPTSAFNKILEYAVFDDDDNLLDNVVSAYANNEIAIIDIDIEIGKVNETDVIYIWGVIPSSNGITFANTLKGYIYLSSYIDAEGNWFDNGATLTDNVNIKLVFEVPQPPQLSGSSAILILLIPTVFAGGVLLYFYKPFKKE